MSTSIYIIGASDLNAQCIIRDLILLEFVNIYVNKDDYKSIDSDITPLLKIYNNENYDILLFVNNEPTFFDKNMIVLRISDTTASFFVDIVDHDIYDEEYREVNIIPIIDVENNIIKTNGHNLKTEDVVYINFLDKVSIVNVLDNYKLEIASYIDKPFINGTIKYIPKSKRIKQDSKYFKISKRIDNGYEPFFSNYISSKICFEILTLSKGILLPLEGWNHYDNKLLNNKDIIIGVYGQNQELIKSLACLNVRINIIDQNLPDIHCVTNEDNLEAQADKLHNNIYQVNEITNETIIICCITNYEQVIKLDEIIYDKEIPLIFFEIDHLSALINAVIPLETDRLINIYKTKKEISYPECMIQNFPNIFEQTVLWALDKFNNNDKLFNNLFHDNIIKLLEIYPDKSFWIKGKLQPTPIINDKIHTHFIELSDKIEWVHNAALLRCKNYGIIPKDINKTREIVTGVKETILNMDSLISNIVVMEMIKYLNKEKLMKIEINMRMNNTIRSELEINKNIWNKFKCTTNYKLIDFIKQYDKILNAYITMVTCGNRIIYAEFIQENNDKLLSELINSGNNIFSLSCDDYEIDLPDIFIII